MNNISFYRKYRPKVFADVVGQKRVVNILENSILKKMVRHAYIFSGPRGTGKTSVAKLFARKINCKCNDNSCEMCINDRKEFSDIWEIDAASNNSINNIRDLIEDATYMPLELSKKVYIIDEVHMLSNAAFNGLLKTLEEPPDHVIFILATTELNKVLPTVLSRCVKLEFDFISDVDISNRLKYVCDNEKIEYDQKALEIIASLSGGGLRDSLSLLETVFSNNPIISIENTIDALNISSEDMSENLFIAMWNKDTNNIKQVIDHITVNGINYLRFTSQFIIYIKKKMSNLIIEDKRIISTWILGFVDLLDNLCYTRNASLLFEAKIMCLSLEAGKFSMIISNDNHSISNDNHSISNDNHSISNDNHSISNDNHSISSDNHFHDEISKALDMKNSFLNSEEKKIINKDNVEIIKENNDDIGSIIEMLDISQNTNIVEEQQNMSKIVLFDVLSTATKEAKSFLIDSYISIKQTAEDDKVYSIAKFFDLSSVRAASQNGCVISIEDSMYELYSKRINEIQKYVINEIKTIEKVFIYSDTIWLSKRDEYITKSVKKKDSSLDVAIKIFGKEHVKKI